MGPYQATGSLIGFPETKEISPVSPQWKWPPFSVVEKDQTFRTQQAISLKVKIVRSLHFIGIGVPLRAKYPFPSIT